MSSYLNFGSIEFCLYFAFYSPILRAKRGLWRMSEHAAIRQPKKFNFFPAFAEVPLRFHNRIPVSISFALTARFFVAG